MTTTIDDGGLEVIRKSAELVDENVPGKYLLRTSASGEFSSAGLKKEGRVTTLLVTEVVGQLPATPLDDRNSMTIENLSNTDNIYINFIPGVTADQVPGTTSGKKIGPNQGLNFDIKNNILIYAIAEAGKSVLVQVVEVA